MSTIFEPSENMRSHSVRLVTKEEAAEAPLSGDYPSEGLGDHLEHFRRADVWLPTKAEAVFLSTSVVSWYGLALRVGLVPPATLPVSSADIRLEFEPPVSQLGAWEPNERFAIYRKMCVKSGKKIKSHLALPGAAEAVLPGIAELVPQLSLDYRNESKAIIVPHDSVIRTASDGERRLAWQLYEDPQNKIDPRQLTARIILGLLPGSAPNMPSPMLTLYAECRCGVLGMRKAVHQKVELNFSNP